MPKVKVDYTKYFAQLHESLGSSGALLVSLDQDNRPNAMTIGWATLGVVWSQPICTVLVRPSRYTYGCINATGDFTVCVPYPEMRDVADFCGTRSGRDYDKFAECNLTALASETVQSPGIEECGAIWECRTIYTSDVKAETLAAEIDNSAYAGGDYHRVYYGLVQRCIADEDLEERFSV